MSIREVEGHLSTFDKLLTLKKERMKDLEMSLLSDGEVSLSSVHLCTCPIPHRHSVGVEYSTRHR